MFAGFFSSRRDDRRLGTEIFALRCDGGTIPDQAFAYEIKDGERGRVELGGKFRAARGEVFYLVHRGPYVVRFAADASAPEYGFEAELAVSRNDDAPQALAALFTEQHDGENWPERITLDDLAQAANTALGDDLLQPCMSDDEWAQLIDTFAYRLRRRFGLSLLGCKAVTLGEQDGVDAARALSELAATVLPEESGPVLEAALDSPMDPELPLIEPVEAVFLSEIARSFRLPKTNWRAPVFRPEALDARLQTRLRAQMPRLGQRVDRLGHAHGDGLEARDRLRLRDLQVAMARSHAGMGYIGELGAQGVGPGRAASHRRRRLAALRDASDSFERLSRRVSDLERGGEGLDPAAIDALEADLDVLSLSLARRAFGVEESLQ